MLVIIEASWRMGGKHASAIRNCPYLHVDGRHNAIHNAANLAELNLGHNPNVACLQAPVARYPTNQLATPWIQLRCTRASQVMHAEAGYKYDGKKADVWSAGVMLYNMLTGAYPFATFEDLRLPQAELIDKIFGRMMEGDFPKPKASRLLLDRRVKRLPFGG